MQEITCPRRMNESGPWEHKQGLDLWRPNDTCSFCGSLKPEVVIARAEQGAIITPTDKNYKGYLSGSLKFYFQHFNEEQKRKFVELYNERKMKLEFPGHFYVLPFFMKPTSSDDTIGTNNKTA